jgi:hypothetical protein
MKKMDGGNNHVRPRRRPRHKFGKVGRLKNRPAARSVAPLSFLCAAVGALHGRLGRARPPAKPPPK